jgi:hypothetical protein
MNERIKELALDAGFIYVTPSSVESWEPFLSLNTNDTCVVPASRELQKFAELIIKECAGIAEIQWHDDSVEQMSKSAVDAILDHFGVKI